MDIAIRNPFHLPCPLRKSEQPRDVALLPGGLEQRCAQSADRGSGGAIHADVGSAETPRSAPCHEWT